MLSIRGAATTALCFLMISAVPASAATTIDTGKSATAYSCEWGYPNTATYGQTFTVPVNDPLLDSFSFFVMQHRDGFSGVPTNTPASIVYRAHVYEWTGWNAGTHVWSSGPQTVETTAGSTASQELSFATAGAPLAPGGVYVAFVSVSEDYAENTDGDKACFADSQTSYSGGRWVFLNNAADWSKWTTATWTSMATDLAFKASFSSPPVTAIYDFEGFYAPVNNRDANGNLILNEVRAGQAIPVKFSLGGDYGLDVFADGYPKSETIACDSDAEVDGVEQTVEAGASTLSYAAGSDTYTYVWKTDTNWDDSCRQLVVRFDDGQTARANFKFKP